MEKVYFLIPLSSPVNTAHFPSPLQLEPREQTEIHNYPFYFKIKSDKICCFSI